MFIFYVSEYTTQGIRWCYWNQTFATSFDNNMSYRVAIFTQMSINIACFAFIFIWRIIKDIKLDWFHVTPVICFIMVIVQFVCQTTSILNDSSIAKSLDHFSYFTQIVLDLSAYGFIILYYTLDRSRQPQPRRPGPRQPLIQHNRQDGPQGTRGYIIMAGVLHLFFLIINFAINIMHETGMCLFNIHYLTSIVENIILFEILHLAIDLIVQTHAIQAIFLTKRRPEQDEDEGEGEGEGEDV